MEGRLPAHPGKRGMCMAEARALRVAVVGCGKIAAAHAGAYVRDGRARLAAAVDPAAEAAADFARRFGVPRTYPDHRAMLDAERPDVVSVCTWPPDHPAPVVDAAAAGARGILCEKPLAVTLPEADRMLAAAERAGAVFMVGHQRRLEARYRLARDLIASGALGEVVDVHGTCGGDLLTDGTHLFDLARFLLGDPPAAHVFAGIDVTLPERMAPTGFGTLHYNATHRRYGHRIEGGAAGHVQFAPPDGARAGPRFRFETGSMARPFGYQHFRVEGTQGRLAVSGDPADGERAWLRVQRRGGGPGGAWEDVPLPPCDPLAAEVGALIDSVLAGAPTPDAALLAAGSARADLELVLAALDSAVRRRLIGLPASLTDHPLERLDAGETRSQGGTAP